MNGKRAALLTVCGVLSACTGGNAITGSKVVTETSSVADAKKDSRSAAENLIGDINMARIAVAHKDNTMASASITHAQTLVAQLRNTTTEKRIEQLSSGRMILAEESHYFPIQTGPMEIKTVSAPGNDIAVKDAQLVYVTVDLGDEGVPETLLAQAYEAIGKGDLRSADRILGTLATRIITVDKRVDLPEGKAFDNITLAQQFMAEGHHNAARYALQHAQEALGDMANDVHYAEHKNDIAALRHDIDNSIRALGDKPVSLPGDMGTKMEHWRQSIKSWMRPALPFPTV